MADCTWPTCLPDDEQDRLCKSIEASMLDQPDPHPYAGDPATCPQDCKPEDDYSYQQSRCRKHDHQLGYCDRKIGHVQHGWPMHSTNGIQWTHFDDPETPETVAWKILRTRSPTQLVNEDFIRDLVKQIQQATNPNSDQQPHAIESPPSNP